ncbi:MAG: hypothetical protein IJL96_10325, partial [Clostridia bacterium]|nr:hypothetical protein [Clostridia bacterium]
LQMALYCEARPILQHEAFHAMPPVGRFQRWQTDDIMLTLSGTGQAEAATCAAVTLAMHHPAATDLFVVLGTCAAMEGKAEKGTLYRARSIEDLGSGRVFYPDLMLDLGLPEAGLLSGYQDLKSQKERVWYQEGRDLPALYDMESAAACAAAGHFFGPHQIMVLRIPSDIGDDAGLVTPENISDMIGQQMDTLEGVFQRLKAFSGLLGQEGTQTPDEDPAFLVQTETALRCSASMSLRFRQLVRYARSAGIAYREILDRYSKDGLLPVPGRKEGKDLLAQFEKELTR